MAGTAWHESALAGSQLSLPTALLISHDGFHDRHPSIRGFREPQFACLMLKPPVILDRQFEADCHLGFRFLDCWYFGRSLSDHRFDS
jgi:hypothetical protein